MAQLEKSEDSSAGRDLKILMAVVTGLLVFIMAARTPLDTDFWWHIRAGEVTWQTGKPLLTDLFSFTRQGQPWTNHSWLAEVILYLVFQAGGYLGTSLLVALLAAGSMLLVYAQLEGPALLKAPVIILASIVAAPVWTPRPQLFSQLLFAALYLVLRQSKDGRGSRLWLLPVLFLAWSNLHAGYTLGFMLIGVVIAGEMLNWLLHPGSDRRVTWRELRSLIFWMLVSVLVVVVNPNGLETWWTPFKTVNIEVLWGIDEWASPDFHQLALQPFLWLLFTLLAAIGLSGRKVYAVDMLGVIGFAYLAFLAKRNFASFALFAAPVLARHLWAAAQSWREEYTFSTPDRKPGKVFVPSTQIPCALRKAINVSMILLLATGAIVKLTSVTQASLIEDSISKYYPEGAVRFMRNGLPPGNIFNSYGWGGYLEWHLHDFPVFIDGRTDLFGDEITTQWLNTIQAGENWEATFTEWEIRYCLIEPDRPLAGVLKRAGATVLFEDETSVLFDISD